MDFMMRNNVLSVSWSIHDDSHAFSGRFWSCTFIGSVCVSQDGYYCIRRHHFVSVTQARLRSVKAKWSLLPMVSHFPEFSGFIRRFRRLMYRESLIYHLMNTEAVHILRIVSLNILMTNIYFIFSRTSMCSRLLRLSILSWAIGCISIWYWIPWYGTSNLWCIISWWELGTWYRIYSVDNLHEATSDSWW